MFSAFACVHHWDNRKRQPQTNTQQFFRSICKSTNCFGQQNKSIFCQNKSFWFYRRIEKRWMATLGRLCTPLRSTLKLGMFSFFWLHCAMEITEIMPTLLSLRQIGRTLFIHLPLAITRSKKFSLGTSQKDLCKYTHYFT